jgi:hypothetical protein
VGNYLFSSKQLGQMKQTEKRVTRKPGGILCQFNAINNQGIRGLVYITGTLMDVPLGVSD